MKFYLAWLIIAIVLHHIYLISIKNYAWLYPDLLLVTVILINQSWKQDLLPKLFYKNNWKLQYFLAAYSLVLIEEIIAALLNNINEGFSFYLFLERILQFWTFNILAFSGLIFGAFFIFLSKLMTKKELLLFVSLYGIYSEDVLSTITTSPVGFFVYTPIVIGVYYMIFKPSISFLPDNFKVRDLNQFIRYLMSVMIIFVLLIPFLLILTNLRSNYPEAFPPCSMIEC